MRKLVSGSIISLLVIYFAIASISNIYFWPYYVWKWIVAPSSVSSSGKAGDFTGEDFTHYCVTTDPDAPAGDRHEQEMVVYCHGYMEAVITMVGIMNGKEVCLPENSTPKDIYGATLEYLQQHPDHKSFRLAGTVIDAAMTKWPCPK